jgi:hypothetical protein
VSEKASEPKRWSWARAVVWSSIILAAAAFWSVVAAAILAWLR